MSEHCLVTAQIVPENTTTHDADEGEEVPIVLMQDVPDMKYHGEFLHFVSESGISQEEYEEAVWDGRVDPKADETLRIQCPNSINGRGHIFKMKRSAMMRSSAFFGFFRSPHYLPGCDMLLTFMLDPAVCFDVAKTYLEEGPDRYTMSKMRLSVTHRYNVRDRFEIYVRLHMLAKKLALPTLKSMAWESLRQMDKLLTPSICIFLARIIFGLNIGFEPCIQNWCFMHIDYLSTTLMDIESWTSLVPDLHPILSEFWAKLMQITDDPLGDIEWVMDPDACNRTHRTRSSLTDCDFFNGISSSTILQVHMTANFPRNGKGKERAIEPPSEEDSEERGKAAVKGPDPMTADVKARLLLGMSLSAGSMASMTKPSDNLPLPPVVEEQYAENEEVPESEVPESEAHDGDGFEGDVLEGTDTEVLAPAKKRTSRLRARRFISRLRR